MNYREKTVDLLERTRGLSFGWPLVEELRKHLSNVTDEMVRYYDRMTPAQRECCNPNADKVVELQAQLDEAVAERVRANHRLHRIMLEIDSRIEHGANSNGHLEILREWITKS